MSVPTKLDHIPNTAMDSGINEATSASNVTNCSKPHASPLEPQNKYETVSQPQQQGTSDSRNFSARAPIHACGLKIGAEAVALGAQG